MTDKDFEVFLNKCCKEVQDKQKELIQKTELNVYKKYSFSQANKSITFEEEGMEALTFEITAIGSWHQKEENWIWAWANESFTEEMRKEAEALKKLKEVTGFDLFEKEGFKCESVVARDLAYMSIHQLEAQGIYRITIEDSFVFLALNGIK